MDSGWGTVGTFYKTGNECLGSFKAENFLTILIDYRLLKKSQYLLRFAVICIPLSLFFFSRDPSYKQDMRKDGVLNQSPPKLCISTESLESPVCDTREFVTNCSASKNPTSNYQQNTSDTNASEWNNGFSRTQLKTGCAPMKQFNHHDSDKKDTVGRVSEVDGNKGHDGRLPDCGLKGKQSKEEPLNVRQRDDSGNVQPPEDADYEDASDGDNVSDNLISNHV